jgi:hypothetical protein
LLPSATLRQTRHIFSEPGEYEVVLTFKKTGDPTVHSVAFTYTINDRKDLEIPDGGWVDPRTVTSLRVRSSQLSWIQPPSASAPGQRVRTDFRARQAVTEAA